MKFMTRIESALHKSNQWRLAARIMEADLPFQWTDAAEPTDAWYEPEEERDVDYYVESGRCTIRIKPLEFPALPAGMQWYNPARVTPHLFGPDYRPPTCGREMEMVKSGHLACEQYNFVAQKWEPVKASATLHPGGTLRVPRSVPIFAPPGEVRKLVPLEYSDMVPGTIVGDDECKERWHVVMGASSTHVLVATQSGNKSLTYAELLRYRIMRLPGSDIWVPCGKDPT